MLWDDPVFEPMMVHGAALGLIQYLLGSNCILSLCDGWLKGKGEARTGVHCELGAIRDAHVSAGDRTPRTSTTCFPGY